MKRHTPPALRAMENDADSLQQPATERQKTAVTQKGNAPERREDSKKTWQRDETEGDDGQHGLYCILRSIISRVMSSHTVCHDEYIRQLSYRVFTGKDIILIPLSFSADVRYGKCFPSLFPPLSGSF